MALFQRKTVSDSDRKGIMEMLRGINNYYKDASVKNHKLNEHKIKLYKYIKWPGEKQFPSTSLDRQNILALIPPSINK